MTASVLLAVLFAALLHASWNAFIKSARDQQADTALVHATGCLWAVPVVAWLGWPPAEAWPFLMASVIIHQGYYTALVGAYRHGDLGLTYPIMRGTAPLLVALSAPVVAAVTGVTGERLSSAAMLGIAAICAGIYLLGVAPAALHSPRRALAVRWALLNAVFIAAYTIVDGQGVRMAAAHGGSAAQYVCTLFLVNGLPYFAFVWVRRDAPGRQSIVDAARRRWPVYALSAAASLGSYGIALWAMTLAPVAVIAALRETSVLFAAALGTVLLKESFGVRRALGTATVLAGIMALRLG